MLSEDQRKALAQRIAEGSMPVSIEEAKKKLDPLLKELSHSEWHELVRITRDLVYPKKERGRKDPKDQ